MNLPKTNLKALSKEELESFIGGLDLPSYRAKQLLHWIYERHVQLIGDITEFSKGLRERLSGIAYISDLILLNKEVSRDGTEKFLFGLEDGETIESVLIPDRERLTLCVSTQVGCALGCRFCLTGKIGLKRDLKAYEIVDQVISVMRGGQGSKERGITNVVLMGMGEPLLNLDEVVEALWRMTEEMKISKRRITLSTAGIAPMILDLPEKAPNVNLAISLNATTNEVRERLMPINKSYPLKVIIDACRRFPLEQRRRITFEYVMLSGINDSMDDAKRLIGLLKGIPCKVNLIPFNPYEGGEFTSSSDDRMIRFQNILFDGGMTAIIRKSKGHDILAACGQLKGRYS